MELNNDLNIVRIRELCEAGALRWTNHILARILQRGISTEDISNILIHDQIIENYPKEW